MSRIPRVVVPDVPHHVTQRGARRMRIFFDDADYDLYRQLLAEQARRRGVSIWAYCLMPNHVHLVAVPTDGTGLARALGEAHRLYAERTNRRHGWRGHLWQERFWSFPLDESALRGVVRYVLMNPVRAGLVGQPEEWPHSSARAHLLRRPDALVDDGPLGRRIADWSAWLGEPGTEREAAISRRHSASGRPLGDERFVVAIEERLGRKLRPKAPGRKRKERSCEGIFEVGANE